MTCRIVKYLFATFARFSCIKRYKRLEHLETILCTWLFHLKPDFKAIPSSLSSSTISICLSLILIGENILLFCLKSILSSLHLPSCSRKRLLSDHSLMLFTEFWIILTPDFGTVSEIVRSSTNLAWSTPSGRRSFIINTKSHGPSLVP